MARGPRAFVGGGSLGGFSSWLPQSSLVAEHRDQEAGGNGPGWVSGSQACLGGSLSLSLFPFAEGLWG